MSNSYRPSENAPYYAPYFTFAQKTWMGLGAALTGGASGALLGVFVLTALIVGSNPITLGIAAGLIGAALCIGVVMLYAYHHEIKLGWKKRKEERITCSPPSTHTIPHILPTPAPSINYCPPPPYLHPDPELPPYPATAYLVTEGLPTYDSQPTDGGSSARVEARVEARRQNRARRTLLLSLVNHPNGLNPALTASLLLKAADRNTQSATSHRPK